MASSCSAAVQPERWSRLSGWTFIMSKRLPTRIMKNSSRLLVKMDTNFIRSSRGTVSSVASESTRSLNASQDSSRFWVKV